MNRMDDDPPQHMSAPARARTAPETTSEATDREAPKPLAAMMEAMRLFPDEGSCRAMIQTARWGRRAFECRRCGETARWGLLRSRHLFQCHRCGHQSSVTAGTPLQNTKLPLRTWFVAAHVIAAVGPRYPATDLSRLLGIWPDAARNLIDRVQPMLATTEGRRFFGLDRKDPHVPDDLQGPDRQGAD